MGAGASAQIHVDADGQCRVLQRDSVIYVHAKGQDSRGQVVKCQKILFLRLTLSFDSGDCPDLRLSAEAAEYTPSSKPFEQVRRARIHVELAVSTPAPGLCFDSFAIYVPRRARVS